MAEVDGVAGKALQQCGIQLETTRREVAVRTGPSAGPSSGSPPFTPRAKKVLELALLEALQLGHNYIGTEHVLLGLIREGEGLGVEVLVSQGTNLSDLRRQVLRLLDGYSGSRPGDKHSPRPEMTPPASQALMAARRLSDGRLLGTQHLLLGLLTQEGSLAAQVLTALGVTASDIQVLVDAHGVAGTTDESPEEAGARTIEVAVIEGEVVINVRHPKLAALLEAGLGPERQSLRGDDPAARNFTGIWAALDRAARELAAQATQAAQADQADQADPSAPPEILDT